MEFFIIRDGQQAGPYTEETVQSLLTNGTVRKTDMGWRSGLPAWMPLNEVLSPGSQKPTEPPPVGTAQSGIRAKPATSRQKALLRYLNANFENDITKDEAAVAISDAFENPRLTARLAKWGEEKLRLHPELYQDELDFRRAGRVARYLELCQTEGSEAVTEITKAHVQVLMESLDKRHAGWEQDQHAALWDFLLPSLAEHFPQLIKDEWKGKLRLGGTSKVAVAYAKSAGTGILTHGPAESRGPGAIHAAFRGLLYGLLALSLVISGFYYFKNKRGTEVVRNDSAGRPSTVPIADQLKAIPGTVPTPNVTVPPGASPGPAVTASSKTSAAPSSADAKPAVPAPEAPAAPSSALQSMIETAAPPAGNPAPAMTNSAFSAAPPPPVPGTSTPPASPEPATAPGAPTVRSTAILKDRVTVQLQFGKVTLNPGTQVRLIALEGPNLRVNFNNNIVVLPVSATDFDPAAATIAPQPSLALPLAPPIVPPTPQVTANTPPPAPAPKPSTPSSDL